MLRIALAEDSPEDAAQIRAHVERFARERGLQAEMLWFCDGAELIEARLIGVDAFLLDIEMPGLDGFKTAQAIRRADRNVPICFVTNLGNLAPEGYAVDAMGFLVKPVPYETFRRTFARLLERMEYRRVRLIALHEGKGERFVDLHGVAYFEARNKRTVVHMADGGTFVCGDALKAIEDKAAGSWLFRIHSAFLVNLEYVEGATATEALVAGDALPVSKHRKQNFMRTLASFIGRQL